jgi:DNA-binding MarR family transcriptional regulator
MTTEREMVASCVCSKVRAAARAVTSAYDEALRPAGLRASQLAVLAAVAIDGSVSITALAQLLGMDRSTLSRNLGPLEKGGLVRIGEGWRRSRTLEITKKGQSQLGKALPLWEKAQDGLRRKLGDQDWAIVRGGLDRLLRAA